MNQNRNKSNEIHGLMKVPDSAIIKNQSIEIGKLNSYIEELEYEMKELKKLHQRKRNSYKFELENLTKKVKSLKSKLTEAEKYTPRKFPS